MLTDNVLGSLSEHPCFPPAKKHLPIPTLSPDPSSKANESVCPGRSIEGRLEDPNKLRPDPSQRIHAVAAEQSVIVLGCSGGLEQVGRAIVGGPDHRRGGAVRIVR